MRRRRRAPGVVIATACTLVVVVSAAARTATPASDVFSAIPGAAVYFEEHGTYVGLTPGYVREWGGARRVLIRRATRRSYCVESVLRPKVHFDGPGGPARKGRCGIKGAVVPSPKPKPAQPPPPTDIAAAQKRLRSAVAWMLGYESDHRTYVGATVEELRAYNDAEFKFPDGVSIIWTTKTEFCLETSAGSNGPYHLRGPAEGPTAGACPAP